MKIQSNLEINFYLFFLKKLKKKIIPIKIKDKLCKLLCGKKNLINKKLLLKKKSQKDLNILLEIFSY